MSNLKKKKYIIPIVWIFYQDSDIRFECWLLTFYNRKI